MSEILNKPDVFLIKDIFHDETAEFAITFLRQIDFDQERRKKIYRSLEPSGKLQNLSVSKVLKAIEPYINHSLHTGINTEALTMVLLDAMLRRPQSYFTIRHITKPNKKLPAFPHARRLTIARGDEEWHIAGVFPDDPAATWFVRPFRFRYCSTQLPNYDPQISPEEKEGEDWYEGRWLVFARLDDKTLSLHWRGFTANNGMIIRKRAKYENDFPYWKYIPELTRELERKLDITTEDINLQYLILETIWEDLRENKATFRWEDILIKADNKGIKLNAHSRKASIEDVSEDSIDIEGIRHLAETIRKGINLRLQQDSEHKSGLPDRLFEAIDEQILRTLITGFNPQVYECAIENIADKEVGVLFHSRAFMGNMEDKTQKEYLKHLRALNYNKSGLTTVDQLRFLLRYILYQPPQPITTGQQTLF